MRRNGVFSVRILSSGVVPAYLWLECSRMGTMLEEIRKRGSEVQSLCRNFGVRRLELFGSAVREQAPRDIDLLVEFEASGVAGYSDRYFGFLESLEELFGRPVDLVVASAVENPYFWEAIATKRVLLYAA